MKATAGAILLVLGAGAALWVHEASVTQKDFDACNRLASTSYWQARDAEIKRGEPMESPQQAHDKIDEGINSCMLAHGYEFTSDRWDKCPVEKIGMCYKRPFFVK